MNKLQKLYEKVVKEKELTLGGFNDALRKAGLSNSDIQNVFNQLKKSPMKSLKDLNLSNLNDVLEDAGIERRKIDVIFRNL